MIIEFNYQPDFGKLWDDIEALPHYKELADLDGIGKQVDMAEFSKNFFRKKAAVADVSVDSNANVEDSSMVTYEVEAPKPLFRINSYYMLWKTMKKLYGEGFARQAVLGQFTKDFYINDFHKFHTNPYCFNFSCLDVVFNGLPFVTKIKSRRPRHLSSFVGQTIQFVTYASNNVAGAVGLADFLICMSYYVDATVTRKDIEQELQTFIYSVNQPFRGGHQSPFTNISLFDKHFLTKMCAEYTFPDGSKPDVDRVQYVQGIYMDVMNKTLEDTPCTFPVTTACFSVDENRNIIDTEFLREVSDANLKFGWINFYAGQTSTLSSCCFTGDTEVLIKDTKNGVRLVSLKELYDEPWKDKPNLTVFNNGFWSKTKAIKVPSNNKSLLKITTVKNQEVNCTSDHWLLTDRGEIQASDLTCDDYLMINTLSTPKVSERDQGLSYEEGVLIGAYLGDGSIYRRQENNGCETIFSLNASKAEKLLPFLNKAISKISNSSIRVNGGFNNVVFVKVNGSEVGDFIENWCHTGTAHFKSLNLNCLLQSKAFRKGVLKGLALTDGHNEYNIIYTSSPQLAKDIECLVSTLGGYCNISLDDRTEEPVVIRKKEYTRNYPVYHVRFNFNQHKTVKDTLKVLNNCLYIKVKDIQEVVLNDRFVYCLEMANEVDHYFTLPNGVHLSNCRLRSEANHEYFNSFGAGGTKIGSMGVVTLNLPRIAQRVISEVDSVERQRQSFMEEVSRLTRLAAYINEAKRYLINKRKENGHLPLYTLGFMDINKQYSTCGLNGINEAVEILGYDILDQSGQELVSELLKTVNDTNRVMEVKFSVPMNCEQTPSENSAIKLAQADKIMGYNPNGYELYSNQFIPLTVKADVLDRIKLQGLFDSQMTGGAILHVNIGEQITDVKVMEDFIKSSVRAGVIYQAINYVLNVCEDDHVTVGGQTVCPICGKKVVEKLTRVVGFLTSVKNWHVVRREKDFPNREFYKGEKY